MSIWKKLGIGVLVLLLLGSIGFLAFRDRILSPERTEKEEQQILEKLPEGELEIIIEEPKKEENSAFFAIEADASALRGGTQSLLDRASELGANAIAVRLKDAAGKLHYTSDIPEAQKAEAVVGNAVSDGAIEDLVNSKYHTVARVTALHDNAFAFRYPDDAAVQQLQYPGVVWYDPDSTFWLAPEKELTGSYLSRIALECAALGFDELLLDAFAYPSNGRQSNIDERGRAVTRSEAIEALAQELFRALEDTQMLLSLELDAQTVLAGGDEEKGQNVEQLSLCFDRIYVKTTASELPKLEKVFAALDVEFVPILTEVREDGVFLLSK